MQQEPFSSIDDFIFHPTFRSWLLDNNSVHKEYWENWIEENPDKVPVMNYAKAIVYALTVNHKQLSEADVENEIRLLARRTNAANRVEEKERDKEPLDTGRPKNPVYKRLVVAAFIIGVCVLIVFYFRPNSTKPASQVDFSLASSKNSSPVTQQSNNSDSIQLSSLLDGSIVKLYPGSKLSFSHGSFNEKREMYLAGEAMFDVKKNSSAPFVVYTQDLVAKVLGTTFTVRAYAHEKSAGVKVTTGRVSVYRKENFSDKTIVANKVDGLIVTANQEVIYDVASHQLRKTIIDYPVALVTSGQETFVFNSTPLKEVFETLQETYGITIIYDETVLSSCLFSASMGDKNFYDKLEVICKANKASYESIDGTIYISSQGCN